MKKSLPILGAFCLGLFISVSIIACAVDDEYNGNNPNEPTPQEEQVPYLVGLYTERPNDGTLEVTYDNGAIDGWVVNTDTDIPITLRAEIVNGSSVLVRYISFYKYEGPQEYTFQCNCDLHELKRNHTERYNALMSQIMMMWNIQLISVIR